MHSAPCKHCSENYIKQYKLWASSPGMENALHLVLFQVVHSSGVASYTSRDSLAGHRLSHPRL